MTNTWKQYEAGKEYKRRIGFYENGRRNERYYRGDQWYESYGKDLPRPVFNVIKRVVDYLVCTIASDRYSLTYIDEDMPFLGTGNEAELRRKALTAISESAQYRWSRIRMDNMIYSMLLDAAIFGDGVAFCYWDKDAGGAQGGDVSVQTVDAANLFAADMNRPDIQSQDYIILSGRATASSLRAEALANGVAGDLVKKILPDDEKDVGAGIRAATELDDEDGKTTYLLKFYREDGKVVFEKSVKECIISRTLTPCRRYPVAYFSWTKVKNSFHGTSPVGQMISAQKFINRAYAMVMKHMTDTAFSKVIYDKSRIPEWTNEVGEAIAVVGAANVSDAVSVIGTGELESGYLGLIENAMATTKEMMGATETALGNTVPNNTSAILALRETSKVSLGQVENALSGCIEDIADIWVDMMCAYYPDERLLPFEKDGAIGSVAVDFRRLRDSLIKACVAVRERAQYSASTTLALLDKLLDGGFIDVQGYLKALPEDLFPERQRLLEERGLAVHE